MFTSSVFLILLAILYFRLYDIHTIVLIVTATQHNDLHSSSFKYNVSKQLLIIRFTCSLGAHHNYVSMSTDRTVVRSATIDDAQADWWLIRKGLNVDLSLRSCSAR